MVIDSSLIGQHSEPQTFTVTGEAVRRFMEATEDAMLHSEQHQNYVPPTFPTTFRIGVPGLELDGTKMQLLHGEQTYEYTRPLRIGEEITCTITITDVRQREGRSGAMTFIVREMVGIDSDQQPVFKARGTSIVRMRG